MSVTKTFKATAPAGTNDREFSATNGALAFAQNLPNGQVADYGDFLASNGFVGANTLDSPVAVGSAGQSLYAAFTNINAFVPNASESNFPLGNTLTTDSSGQITGLPGLTFYTDPGDTTPFANGQLVVEGIIAEAAVPEPSALVLAGTAALCLLAYSRYRRWRPAAMESRL